ncbi:MAG: AhpC/TSA family protein [Prevotella sp.]|nr:AhpC/TSA family protein [Prevotella sp.]
MRTFYKVLALSMAVAAMGACSQKEKFTVEGTIEGAQDSVLYLHHMALSGPVVIDSVRLGADGAFSFKADAPEAPDFYVLRIDGQIINFSIDSTETVSIHARYPGMAANYNVEGSDNCERIRQLALRQQELQRRVIALQRGLIGQQLADSVEALVERYKQDVTMNFIYQGPDQTSSYFALFQTLGQVPIFNPHASRDDMRVFGAVATSWDTYYPEAERTQNLRNITLKSMNEARTVDARENQVIDADKFVQSGVVELSLPDNKGQLRTLTELKGRVVLLDFHAFATSESAARILLLRELYNKYHDRGLEIYQVSIDPDEHFWKQQVAALPWITVRDASGESLSKYNVQAVPEFFTIDRQNQLQKRSTQMTDLEAEIKALL